MFARLLIANRGEIACRVMRTARRLGIRTATVYVAADAGAQHVRLADEAWPIPSYLDGDAVIAAARASGAQAIHPGYGFLAENEAFAAACGRAGLVFVGPTPEAIAAMGDKAAAKRRMEKARVPLVPGYHGEAQDAALLAREAARIGYPVLIKPSAGGGGKGMHVVGKPEAFAAALAVARREAKSSFGDERVLIERYIERPRHIEVQVFGDAHGNVVYLFERDCSVQRRHQKIIEEAPAPGMSAARRREMGEAAVTAARAIGYRNAGTVEFIVEQDGRFYFMEMNTRLQVEHPVTEMITGLDLVELQLAVAAGEALPFSQEDLRFAGHALEARIYAEDPERDFLPSTGRLLHVAFPPESAQVRIDSGVETGAEVTPWFDPMLAKLIVHGEDRAQALGRLRQALSAVQIAGVKTNVAFLGRLAGCRAFVEAQLDTGLIEQNRAELFPPPGEMPIEVLAAAAFAELAEEERAARQRAAASGDPYSPWHRVDGWRLNEDSHHDFVFLDGAAEHPVRVRFVEGALRLALRGGEHALAGEPLGEGLWQLRLGGRSFKARAVPAAGAWHIFRDGTYRHLTLKEELPVELQAHGGSLTAPMPGKVVQVLARAGAAVRKGEALMILEAMKMEHTIAAPADGRVKEVHFAAGEPVNEGAVLITLD